MFSSRTLLMMDMVTSNEDITDNHNETVNLHRSAGESDDMDLPVCNLKDIQNKEYTVLSNVSCEDSFATSVSTKEVCSTTFIAPDNVSCEGSFTTSVSTEEVCTTTFIAPDNVTCEGSFATEEACSSTFIAPSSEDEWDVDDPDYVPNSEDSCDNITDGTAKEHTEAENIDNYTTKKRKGVCNKNEWKRNKTRKLREKGQCYLGRKRRKNCKDEEVKREERKLGRRCQSEACKKSTKRFCSEISEDVRAQIFNHFWAELNWDERKAYVGTLVSCVPPKQKRRIESGDRRGSTFHYFLQVNNEKKEVCRDMFCHTFSLGVWSVRNWAKNVVHGMTKKPDTKEQPKQRIDNVVQTSKKDFAVAFVESLPKLPSHYCRKDSGKLYLENTFRSEMELYRLYQTNCNESGIDPLSRFTFNKILCDMNVALFQPRKDQCDVCCEYKVGNLSQDEYEKHIKAKDRARLEKEIDKQKAADNLFVALCVDVQAVKLSPFLKASAIYFKTKLCNHNYTVYNLNNSEVDCYWWSEVEGELKAKNFTSLLISHLQKLINNWNPSVPKIIKIWSDGCCYQNGNKVLSNALLNLAVEHNFIIHQKYLHVGHTQMEVDSVHATIERRLTNKEIYLPSDYVSATKEARLKPFPYRGHFISHTYFKDYTGSNSEWYSSIRPGKKVSDPTVTDVCQFQYLPCGEITYKLQFEDEFQSLPRRPKSVAKNTVYPQLYTSRLSVSQSKWDHLQQLKSVIPSDVHAFYDSLGH